MPVVRVCCGTQEYALGKTLMFFRKGAATKVLEDLMTATEEQREQLLDTARMVQKRWAAGVIYRALMRRRFWKMITKRVDHNKEFHRLDAAAKKATREANVGVAQGVDHEDVDHEFYEKHFQMLPHEFLALKPWKQKEMRQKAGLF